VNGHREPMVGEHYVALNGHAFVRRDSGPLHLAHCRCWNDPLAAVRELAERELRNGGLLDPADVLAALPVGRGGRP
jgi:hypothetical protein